MGFLNTTFDIITAINIHKTMLSLEELEEEKDNLQDYKNLLMEIDSELDIISKVNKDDYDLIKENLFKLHITFLDLIWHYSEMHDILEKTLVPLKKSDRFSITFQDHEREDCILPCLRRIVSDLKRFAIEKNAQSLFINGEKIIDVVQELNKNFIAIVNDFENKNKDEIKKNIVNLNNWFEKIIREFYNFYDNFICPLFVYYRNLADRHSA